MDIDPKTINLYLREALAKIDLIKADIASYEYRIKQSVKEIATLNYLIDQYEKALEILKHE